VSGFVNIEGLLKRQGVEQFPVGGVEGSGDLFDHFAQVAARDVFAEHVADELADRGIVIKDLPDGTTEWRFE